MKKLVLSIIVMGSFGFYVLWQSQGNSSASFIATTPIAFSPKKSSTSTQTSSTPKTPPKQTPTPIPTPIPTPTFKPTPIPVPVPTPAPVVKKSGLYNDGSYTGPVSDAYYGNVQVRAVISNGKLVDVQFLDYPQDRNTSRRINSYAMPYLTQEAISAQSANVNGVTGASDTSAAFRQSLSSALAQAKR